MKKEKLNADGLTMKEVLEFNKLKIAKENKTRNIQNKACRTTKNIFGGICIIGVLIMLVIGLNAQLDSSVDKCVNAGNEINFCKGGLR